MSYVIYEQSSTFIMGKPYMGEMRPDHRKSYKTLAAAEAALTRASKQWWNMIGRMGNEPTENDPRYRMAIAAKAYFHQNIEKKVAKRNLSTGIVYEETVNTPAHMSPACETYWSM
jgi:hypothetical protein